jgi:predicted RNA-binding Zn-ribbon protein involved in translation (DUF1610 family)
MTGMKVMDFKCPECGGTRKAPERALMLICEYCGATIGFDQDARTVMDMSRRVMDYVRNPSREWVRFQELALELQKARDGKDRQTYKVLIPEYYSLYSVLYPDYVPVKGREAVREWLRQTVVSDELNWFDPGVSAALKAYTGAMGDQEMMRRDPVQWARRVMETSTTYYKTVAGHPDCPQGVYTISPGRYARKTLEATLPSMLTLLGEENVNKIKTEVLGEKQVKKDLSACPECAAPLPPGERFKCPFCGTVLVVQRDDAWVTQHAATFDHAVETSGNMNPETAVSTALAFFITGLQADPAFPGERAVAFLRRTVPWASRELILKQASYLFERSPFLQVLSRHLAAWSPSGAQPAFGSRARGAADPDALWTQELVKLWKQSQAGKRSETPQQEALGLIVMALYPFHIGGACTVEHALGFFAAVDRGCSDRDLAEAIGLLRSGYASDRGISEFLDVLESRLRGR